MGESIVFSLYSLMQYIKRSGLVPHDACMFSLFFFGKFFFFNFFFILNISNKDVTMIQNSTKIENSTKSKHRKLETSP